jgi:DNA-binding beta-propeller fold protein YncE
LARFAAPAGMAADRHGNVFIVDQTDSIVRKLTSSGQVSTFAGRTGHTGRSDGQGTDAQFNHPTAIAVDAADNLYVADTGNRLVRKISPAGVVTTVAGGEVSTGSASGALRLLHPTGVVCAPDGSLYVIDRNEDTSAVVIQVLPGGELKALAGPEAQTSSSELRLPMQVVIEDESE